MYLSNSYEKSPEKMLSAETSGKDASGLRSLKEKSVFGFNQQQRETLIRTIANMIVVILFFFIAFPPKI